jgi:hypothetical protein
MTAGKTLLATTLAALTVVGAGGTAWARWIVDAKGQCVEQWSPTSMLRGPTAMVMSPTAPFRNGAGVFAYQSPDAQAGSAPSGSAYWTPVLAVLSGAAGIIDTCVWLGTGLADTVTGGYFAIAPEDATRLSLEPLIPPFVSEAQRRTIAANRPDPCVRRLPGGAA